MVDGKSLGDVTHFVVPLMKRERPELALQASTKRLLQGNKLAKIGNTASCVIRPNSRNALHRHNTDRSLESHGEVYVNGEKVAVADLTQEIGLIGETEFIYHEEWPRNMRSLWAARNESHFIYQASQSVRRFSNIQKRSPRIIKTEPYALRFGIKTRIENVRREANSLSAYFLAA